MNNGENMKQKIVVGSRDSKLAVLQSNMVVDYIKKHCADTDVSLLTMKTTGDIKLEGPLYEIGGKGLFVKELDIALMEKRSDLSVHSLKDMPMEVSEMLPILGFSKREDPRDVLVLPLDETGKQKLFNGQGIIGCSSLRRTLQLQKLFPEAEIKSIRGNVQTRLSKLDSGQYDAIVLAAAGLKRLGLEERISRYFETDEILPAAGQGILAVQGRAGEDYRGLEGFFDQNATACAIAERAFVRAVNGGCSSPIAAHAVVDGRKLTLTVLYYDENTKKYIKAAADTDIANAEAIGSELAEKFIGVE